MWFRAIIAKVLVGGVTEEETTEVVNEFAKTWWDRITRERDGSLFVSKPTFVPEDDVPDYLKRTHYFITHPSKFELPFELKYPRERLYPECPHCKGTGEIRDDIEGEDDDGTE